MARTARASPKTQIQLAAAHPESSVMKQMMEGVFASKTTPDKGIPYEIVFIITQFFYFHRYGRKRVVPSESNQMVFPHFGHCPGLRMLGE